MKLTKEKLKRIIKEEVIKKLLEQDDDISFRDPSRRGFLKLAPGAVAMATGIGALDNMVDDKEARAAALQARREKAAETLESDEYLLENLITFLKQSVNFSWSWSANEDSKSLGSGEGFSQPEDFPVLGDREWGTLLILSPEYGVARKVYDDVRKQIENKQELKQYALKGMQNFGMIIFLDFTGFPIRAHEIWKTQIKILEYMISI